MAERVVKIIIRGDSKEAEASIKRLSNALRKMDEDLARSAKQRLQGIDVSQMQRAIDNLRRSGKQFYDDQARDARRATEATKQAFKEQERAVAFAAKTLDKYDNQLAKLGGYDSEVRRLNKSLADPSVAKHLDDNTKALLREKAALIDAQRETQKLAKEREKLSKARIQKVENFGNATQSVGQGIQTTGTAMTAAVTAPVAGFAAYVIKVGSEYETAMNIFQKATEATNDEMQRAEKLAIALGNDMTLPGVSAKDAAEAMTELGKAGMTAAQAMDAAQGTLRLATAAGISAGEAAEITANALNAFKLPASDAARVADLLAGAANASSAEITDVAASMQQAGAIFAAAHVPIEDLTTAIGLMANSGIKGSDAGTSLKSMLLKLQSPSKAAAATLDELGIKIYDAQGKMKPMRDIIEQLGDKTKNLTQQQKDQALATIFGSDAIRAANILINEGTAGWDKMSESVQRTNAAQELAAARTKGLAGAWEAVKSQFETFALIIYNRVKEPLTNLLVTIGEFVAKVMDGFTSLSPAVQNFILIFAGIAAAIGPVLVVVGTLVVGIGSLITTIAGAAAAVGGFAALGGIIAGVVAAFALLAAGVGAAIGVVYALVEAWDKGFGPVASYVAIVVAGIITAFSPILGLPILIGAVLATIYGIWTTNFGGIRDVVYTAINDVTAIVQNFIAQIQPFITDGVRFIQEKFAEYWGKLSGPVSDASSRIRAVLFEAWTQISAFLQENLQGIVQFFQENWGTIKEAVGRVMDAIAAIVGLYIQQIQQFWTTHGEQIKSVVTSVWNIVTTVISTVIQQILNVIKLVAQAINGDWAGVWETFKQIVHTGVEASWNILKNLANIVWQAIKGVIDSILGAGASDAIIEWVTGIGDSVSSGFDTVTTAISDAFNALIEPFRQIFSVISEEVSAWLTENEELINQAAQPFKDAFDAIYNTVSEVLSAIGDYISSWWDTILSYWESATTSISEFFSAAWDALARIVSPALEAVSNVISTVGNGIGTIWNSIWNSAKEIFSAVWQAIVSTVRLVVQTVLGVIKSILQLITGDWRGAWNTAKSVVQNIFESIGTILTNLGTRVWNALKAIVQTVIDVGSDLYNKAVEIGRNLVEGLINGMSALKDRVVSTAKSIITAPLNLFRSEPQVQSPSKVTTKIGEYIGEGLAVGMKNRANFVKETAKKVIKDSLGELDKEAKKAIKEFNDLANLSPAGIASKNATAEYGDAKSKLEEIIKLRRELNVDAVVPLPKTFADTGNELERLKKLDEARKLLKELEKSVANFGKEATNVQKAEDLLADETAAKIDEQTRAQLRFNAALLDAKEKAEKYKKAKDDLTRSNADEITDLEAQASQFRVGADGKLSKVEDKVELERIKQQAELIKYRRANAELDADELEARIQIIEAANQQKLQIIGEIQAKEQLIEATKTFDDAMRDLNDKMVDSARVTELDRVQKLLLTDAYKNLTPEQKKSLELKAQEVDAWKEQQEAIRQAQEEMKKLYDTTVAFFEDTIDKLLKGDFKGIFKGIFDQVKKNFIRGVSEWLAEKILGFNPNDKTNNPVARPIVDKIQQSNKFLQNIEANTRNPAVGNVNINLPNAVANTVASAIGNVISGGTGGSSGSSGFNINNLFSGFGGLFGTSGTRTGDVVDDVIQVFAGDKGRGNLFSNLKNFFSGKQGSFFGKGGFFGKKGFGLNSGTIGGLASIASLIGGFIPGKAGSVISSTASMALMGLQIAGPWGALVGGAIGFFTSIFGSAKRRRDKNEKLPQLQQGFSDALQQLRDLLAGVKALRIDPDEALSKAQEIRSAIASGFGIQFESKKYKKQAQGLIQMRLSEADALIAQLQAAAAVARAANERARRIVPEFANGGFTGAKVLGWDGARLMPFTGLVPGVYDRKDDFWAKLTGNEVVLTPDVWQPITPYLKQKRVPGFADGGAASANGTRTIFSPTDSSEKEPIVIRASFELDSKGMVHAVLTSEDGRKAILEAVEDGAKNNDRRLRKLLK